MEKLPTLYIYFAQQKILCIKTITSSQKHIFTYGFGSKESIKIWDMNLSISLPHRVGFEFINRKFPAAKIYILSVAKCWMDRTTSWALHWRSLIERGTLIFLLVLYHLILITHRFTFFS